jgi:hypothetical protein
MELLTPYQPPKQPTGDRIKNAEGPSIFVLKIWDSTIRWNVDPFRSPPSRLGEPEAQAGASCFLAPLVWDVERDLLAWLSVDDAIEAVAK